MVHTINIYYCMYISYYIQYIQSIYIHTYTDNIVQYMVTKIRLQICVIKYLKQSHFTVQV